MPVVERSLRMHVAPARVWPVVGDLRRRPEWDRTTERVTRLSGDGGVGSRYERVARFGRCRVVLLTVVAELEPGVRVRYDGLSRPLRNRTELELSPDGDGTLVRLLAWYDLRSVELSAADFDPERVAALADEQLAGLARVVTAPERASA